MRRFNYRVVSEVEHDEDDRQDNRQHKLKPCAGALLVLVLAAPLKIVSGRQLHAVAQHLFGFFNKTADIAVTDVERHHPAQQAILT